LSLDCEVSVVLARDEAGLVQSFPTAENSHRQGILDVSLVPARAAAALHARAAGLAATIAERLGYIGTLAVEFFVVGGELLINEMAPRPHNSGHYTLDACITSQYEQQVRALCGLPLGDPRAHSAAAMVNLLGDLWYENGVAGQRYREPDWSPLYAFPGPQAASLRQASRPARAQDGPLHRRSHATRNVPGSIAMAARAAIGIWRCCLKPPSSTTPSRCCRPANSSPFRPRRSTASVPTPPTRPPSAASSPPRGGPPITR
jgi:5-(carboxyamino)imidazole ribonucleotide synthase